MRFPALISALIVLATAAAPLPAQDFPTRSLRIVVPYTAGGPVDFVGRTVQHKLEEAWKQSIVFDNRPGASAMLGSSLVARSEPDGYTLLIGGVQTHAMNVATIKQMMYDPLADFTAISQLTSTPWLLVTHPSVGVRTPRELADMLKKSPGKYSYASAGVGGVAHLGFEMLSSALGTRLVHVPYKGTSQAVNDVLAGQVPMMMGDQATLLQHVKAGRLVAVAVTGDKRSSLLPEVPTIAETLVPGFDVQSWQGLWGPAGMDKALAARINADFARVLRMPEVRAKLQASGYEPVASTMPQFDVFIRKEIERWTQAAKAAGINPE